MAPAGEAAGVTSLSGNLSKAKEETKGFTTDSDHLQNLGMMIEAMENTLRSDIDGARELLACCFAEPPKLSCWLTDLTLPLFCGRFRLIFSPGSS